MDMVNHPPHYTSSSGMECIDAIEAMTETMTGPQGFRLGNALKYLWRAHLKGDRVENLRKAEFYLCREIAAVLDERERAEIAAREAEAAQAEEAKAFADAVRAVEPDVLAEIEKIERKEAEDAEREFQKRKALALRASIDMEAVRRAVNGGVSGCGCYPCTFLLADADAVPVEVLERLAQYYPAPGVPK
jgi:hypothetical protein